MSINKLYSFVYTYNFNEAVYYNYQNALRNLPFDLFLDENKPIS